MTHHQAPAVRILNIDNHTVTIRPIIPEDAQLEKTFIKGLSPTTSHFRFLGGVNELPDKLLAELCDVDFDHSAALIATIGDGKDELEIGVVRYAPDSHDDVREMAITIADEWQHKGLGTKLANELVDFARSEGIKELYSVDLADNHQMRELALALGMEGQCDPSDVHQVIYSLTL